MVPAEKAGTFATARTMSTIERPSLSPTRYGGTPGVPRPSKSEVATIQPAARKWLMTSLLVSGSRDGAQSSRVADRRWPIVTTGRPPIGAGVFGTATEPVTAMSRSDDRPRVVHHPEHRALDGLGRQRLDLDDLAGVAAAAIWGGTA